jgi:anti-sigma regulatory factor (Ser/Thr protein kinase)
MPAMRRFFPAEPTSLRDVRDFIRERAREAALYRSEADDLIQAVSEVCANAVLHTGSSTFIVSWSARPGEPAEVSVRDQGVFALRGMRESSEGDSHGFGLPLAAALVDEVSIVKGTPGRPGTTVRLLKYRAR